MAAKRSPSLPAAPAEAPARTRSAASRIGLPIVLGLVVAGLSSMLFLKPGGGSGGSGAAAVAPAATAAAPKFDGQSAFKDLEKQVSFGPRVPNQKGHVACADYLIETLKPLADSVERQPFTQRVGSQNLRMNNILARWKGTGGKNGVLLCAHWDTRPTADFEENPEDRRKPILGANDGASGVAVLLEAARMFKKNPPPVPVMIVFFDGEDFGPGVDRMFLGSRYFARKLPADVPRRGILLDMVGDRDLQIPKEAYSVQNAQEVVDEVYDLAAALGHGKYFPRLVDRAIEDDHIPLQQRGLKVIDLIDFDYGPDHTWWHTLEDTPDKCSPQSLAVVGEVVTRWVYQQK